MQVLPYYPRIEFLSEVILNNLLLVYALHIIVYSYLHIFYEETTSEILQQFLQINKRVVYI